MIDKLAEIKTIITQFRNLDITSIAAINKIEDLIDADNMKTTKE